MQAVETELHLELKVDTRALGVNDVAELVREIGREIGARLLWAAQEEELARVQRGGAELVCKGCGIVHTGPDGLLRRGRRRRTVQTSAGPIGFDLRQLTCSACRCTWCPFAETLGLLPRQRVSEEVIRRLFSALVEMSYAKSSALGAEWLGSRVSARTLHRAAQEHGSRVAFREPAAGLGRVVADGTKVPAGPRPRGEDLCVALEIQGRSTTAGRRVAHKRVVGLGVGWGCWQEALATASEPSLLVTDGEVGVRELVAAYYPSTRHQLCEWHVPHTLRYYLTLDGVPVQERNDKARTLGRILARGPKGLRAYDRFLNRLHGHPVAQQMLRNVRPYILQHPTPEERTTSLAEREMRELNRRTDIGARWSVPGVTNLLRLLLVRIPAEAGHRFRSKPATHSGRFRPPIPEQAGH